jgi:hypothetical protein
LVNTTDSHCWLSGQASVGFLPLAENKMVAGLTQHY